jgi:endonuclease/exonuclease/phosphatase family metal-dependent hydrolase
MLITSLNLQGFENWEERLPAILSYLKTTNPDIILLQEAVYLPELSPFNQAQLLNQSLNYTYELSTISRLQVGLHYPTYREGLVILSKHPIIRSDTIVLKQARGDEHNRIVQLADIHVNDITIPIANVHFSITDHVDYATPHLKELLEVLGSRDEQRVIAGDFNLSNIEPSGKLWDDTYSSSSSFSYISFPEMNKRIDYALIPKVFRFNDVSVSGDGLSDHRALTIDIT